MPTVKYVYEGNETDPDETLLEEDDDEVIATQMDFNTDNTMDEADNKRSPATPQFTQPLPLRGGGRFAPSTQSSISAAPSTNRRSKKARLKELAEMMDSDESDEELSEQAFLEGLARRQREQMERMESQTQRGSISFAGTARERTVGDGPLCISRGRQESRNTKSYRSRSRSVGRKQNDSLCTQNTTQMGNRSVDVTARDQTLLGNSTMDRDQTLLGNTVDDLQDSMNDEFAETQAWEKEMLNIDTDAPATPKKNASFHSGRGAAAANNPYQKQQYNQQRQKQYTQQPKEQKPRKSIPKMSFEQLKQRRQSFNKQPGWQTQAYQSSLTDLISSFLSTPESEQTLASCQLARKRCFDATSRALARLAIVSRSGNVVNDCNPPSPRSLPSFMSVMNVQGPEDGMHDVFVGQSVHGRCARTVCLGLEEGVLEQLTLRAAQFAAGVCSEAGGGKMTMGLVEAALEFLATAFACLECDLVYDMLLLSVNGSKDERRSLFDVLLDLAPNEDRETANNMSTLAFLAVSRGLEAANFVARYATSLDSAGCCKTYASPHTIIRTLDHNTIDEGGVGFLSALGKDLCLHLEDYNGVRVGRLNEMAKYAYDSILRFNPMISTDNGEPYRETSSNSRDDRRGRENDSLCVDTDVGLVDSFQCRQPSVVKDRMCAAYVEYLSSLIQIGVVSGWLNSDSDKTVEKLCQKLFLVIETRSRLRRSTNQRTSNDSSGDSESVCAASLSLLLLALPMHQENPADSMSFRKMGGSTGTISDVFESPLVKRMVELGLSLSCEIGQKESAPPARTHALTSILYSLIDLVVVGGASLISRALSRQLNKFLADAIVRVSQLETIGITKNGAHIEAVLLFLLHLHNGCPNLVRETLRNHFEQSACSENERDASSSFVGNLLQLCAHPSFSVSSAASALFRSLLKGSPLDNTSDVLSDIIVDSFETDYVSSSVDSAFHSLVEMTYATYDSQAGRHSSRHLPRICFVGDMLNTCLTSSDMQQMVFESFAVTFKNKSVLDVFADMLHMSKKSIDGANTLFTSSTLSIISLLSHVLPSCRLEQNLNVSATLESTGLMAIESAMSQGTSSDLTHRALKHQKSLQVNENTLALTFTKLRSNLKHDEASLCNKINEAEQEIRELRDKLSAKEEERAKLSIALNDQRGTYEKKLELVKFESQSIAKKSAEIHIHERKRAEQHALKHERLYRDEREKRRASEEEAQRLKNELSRANDNTSKLQEALDQEQTEKDDAMTALEANKRELEMSSKELEELQAKLLHSEKISRDLSINNKDLEAAVEETCEKLVNLATIYQRNETEMDKYKMELRSAVNAANKNCDTAISKYEAQRKENKSLKKELESTIAELNEMKAQKADVQRLRKTAPTQYINQLRNDPRVQARPQKSRSGKENSFSAR